MNSFPVDEDNHFIDVLKVFNLSTYAELLVDLNTKPAIGGPEKATKITQDFEDFYKSRLQ